MFVKAMSTQAMIYFPLFITLVSSCFDLLFKKRKKRLVIVLQSRSCVYSNNPKANRNQGLDIFTHQFFIQLNWHNGQQRATPLVAKRC